MARNRKKLGSLTHQIEKNLNSKLTIGHSKNFDKLFNKDGFVFTSKNIYSWDTYKSYLKHCNYFADYCKEKHNCRTLDECKQYIGEWLQTRNDLSPYTIRLEMASLCKLYDITTEDIAKDYGYIPPKRKRANITRSRGNAKRDKNFSKTKNSDFVTFCKCTGLRRAEITALKADSLIKKGDQYYVNVVSGAKGGRKRQSPIMAQDVQELEIVLNAFKMVQNSPNKKVWAKVPNGADIHSYRADYATRCYLSKAKPIEELKETNPKDLYRMNGDRKGVILDRSAMLFASRCLGHKRIDVIASHYLRNI